MSRSSKLDCMLCIYSASNNVPFWIKGARECSVIFMHSAKLTNLISIFKCPMQVSPRERNGLGIRSMRWKSICRDRGWSQTKRPFRATPITRAGLTRTSLRTLRTSRSLAFGTTFRSCPATTTSQAPVFPRRLSRAFSRC